MKNILVVLGSGTRKGTTAQLADSFMKGAVEVGNKVERVFLGDLSIEGCKGCNACRKRKSCVIQDSMQEIYPLFEKSDVIVFASPLYFWTLSARIKAFIERLYAISEEDTYPKKECVLLMTAGDNNFWTFEQAVSYYRFVTKAIEWEDIGMCLAGGTKYEEGKHVIEEIHLENSYKLGKSI